MALPSGVEGEDKETGRQGDRENGVERITIVPAVNRWAMIDRKSEIEHR